MHNSMNLRSANNYNDCHSLFNQPHAQTIPWICGQQIVIIIAIPISIILMHKQFHGSVVSKY
jgi:hypothetical protein